MSNTMCKKSITYWSCGHQYKELCDGQKDGSSDIPHGSEVADWAIDAQCRLCRDRNRRRNSIEQFYDDRYLWYNLNKRASSSDPTMLSIEKVPGDPESRENVQKLSNDICKEDITISSHGYPHDPSRLSFMNGSKAEALQSCDETLGKLEEFGRTLRELLGRIEAEQNRSVSADVRAGTNDPNREEGCLLDWLQAGRKTLEKLLYCPWGPYRPTSILMVEELLDSLRSRWYRCWTDGHYRPTSLLMVEELLNRVDWEWSRCVTDHFEHGLADATRKHESINYLLRACDLRTRELRYVRSLIDEEFVKPYEACDDGMDASDLIECLVFLKAALAHRG